MKVRDFNKKKPYSEVSGATALVDENIIIELNDFGNYEERVLAADDYELNNLVEYISPNLNERITEGEIAESLYGKVEGIKYDKRIGYYKSLYAGHVLEGSYRENASSGGMGTWILKELLEKDLIDGIIHVKENQDKSSPVMFQYDISRTLDEIKAGAKTKYYPVEFSKVIKKVKEIPGRYAIIGIPSFVMAIRLLAESDVVIKERIKFTVGLICGHQKSSKFAEALAWQVGIKPGDLKHINFRKKLLDKPANNYGVEIVGEKDGEEVTIVKPTKELLGQNWGQGYFKPMASDFTDDVMNETADITLGDAWLTDYTKDSEGNNVVVVRDPQIDKLIKDAINSNRLNLDVINEDTICESQSGHFRHTYDELPYRLYKKDRAKVWRPRKRVEASKNLPLIRRKVQDLREEISVKSNTIYKKAVELDDLNYYKFEMSKLTKKYNLLYKLIIIQNKGFGGITKVVIRKLIKKK